MNEPIRLPPLTLLLTSVCACALAALTLVLMDGSLLGLTNAINATIVVNDTGDAPDASGGSGTCATAGGVCTLRAAIQTANANAGTDTIAFALGSGLKIITLTSSLPAVSSTMTVDGPGHLNLEINGAGNFRAFNVLSGTTATIQKITIRKATGGSGGALVNNGTLTLTSMLFISNTAQNGGAIVNGTGNPAARLYVADSAFISNTANGTGGNGTGGSIDVPGGGAQIVDTYISASTAITGGAIRNGGTLTVTGSAIYTNTASKDGGGIANKGKAWVVNTALVANTAQTGEGGGLLNSISGTLTVSNTTISANSAASGGGIANRSTVSATNVTIAFNSAAAGGGLNNLNPTIQKFELTNSLVVSNTAGNCAGTSLVGVSSQDFPGNTCGGPTNSNPNIQPLASNGTGAVGVKGYAHVPQTHAILQGSPVVDTAFNSRCAPFDQRGFPRTDGDANGSVICDVGAYEAPTGTLPTATQTPTAGPTPTHTPTATPVNGPDIQITKFGPAQFNSPQDLGTQMVYTIVVRNIGTQLATIVRFTDTIPGDSEIADVSGIGCTTFQGYFTCGYAQVFAQTAGFTTTVKLNMPAFADCAGFFVNSVLVTSSSDTNTGNNSAEASTLIVCATATPTPTATPTQTPTATATLAPGETPGTAAPTATPTATLAQAAIQLIKQAPPSVLSPANLVGDLMYTLTVRNIGQEVLFNLVLTDTLPGGVKVDGGSGALDCDLFGTPGQVTCLGTGTLSSGEEFVHQFFARVESPPACNSTLMNNAAASAQTNGATASATASTNTTFTCPGPVLDKHVMLPLLTR